eukprot:3245091-Prymnesium_polylepis.1
MHPKWHGRSPRGRNANGGVSSRRCAAGGRGGGRAWLGAEAGGGAVQRAVLDLKRRRQVDVHRNLARRPRQADGLAQKVVVVLLHKGLPRAHKRLGARRQQSIIGARLHDEIHAAERDAARRVGRDKVHVRIVAAWHRALHEQLRKRALRPVVDEQARRAVHKVLGDRGLLPATRALFLHAGVHASPQTVSPQLRLGRGWAEPERRWRRYQGEERAGAENRAAQDEQRRGHVDESGGGQQADEQARRDHRDGA